MIVSLLASSFPASPSDWRSVFIRHLAEAIARQPEVGLELAAPPGPLAGSVKRLTDAADDLWLGSLMASGGVAHLLRRKPVSGLAASIRLIRTYRGALRRASADVHHVNWLQNALALPHDGKPAVIAALGSDLALLRWPFVTLAVRHFLKTRRAVICPNADWMVPNLVRSFGDLVDVRVVPFGINKAWFAVSPNRARARWLVVSRLTHAKLGPLFDWAEAHFSVGKRELHLIGPRQEDIDPPPWVRYHGARDPEELAREWFPSATGLLTLSRHSEGRPQVLLEAMASGLPVIASDQPAHRDLLVHRQTGWIVGQPGDLGEALATLEDSTQGAAMGERARAWVRQQYGDWDDCARRYLDVYKDLLADRTP